MDWGIHMCVCESSHGIDPKVGRERGQASMLPQCDMESKNPTFKSYIPSSWPSVHDEGISFKVKGENIFYLSLLA